MKALGAGCIGIVVLSVAAFANAEDKQDVQASARDETTQAEGNAKADTKPNDQENRWRDGWFRLEGSAITSWKSGRHERAGDYAFRLLVDYEVPVIDHMTVGPRVMPFMYWNENNDGDNNIYAAGLGIAFRGYVRKAEYRGFYGELGLMVIGQTDKFAGNSGGFNFLEEIGVGYVFKSDVSTSFKLGHISNACLADKNAGVNWASLGLGYSFRHRP